MAASRICQNILLTKYATLEHSHEIVISILKMRDSNFERAWRHLTVGPDGTVEMSAEDAEAMIRAGFIKLAEWTGDDVA